MSPVFTLKIVNTDFKIHKITVTLEKGHIPKLDGNKLAKKNKENKIYGFLV